MSDVSCDYANGLLAQLETAERALTEARAECQEWNDELDARVREGCAAAESRLADAVALLERTLYQVTGRLSDDVRAFLASAQPAPLAECGDPLGTCPCPPAAPARTEAKHVSECRYEQESPALDPEDCPRCAQAIEALREGTEAEQAVTGDEDA